MKQLLTLFCTLPLLAIAQNTYTWQTTEGSWVDPASWLPQRANPLPDDILVFASNTTVTAMPESETIGRLTVQAGAQVEWVNTGASSIKISAALAAPQLEIHQNAFLHLNGAEALRFHLSENASASIAGAIQFNNAGHQVTSLTHQSIVFSENAVFTAGTGFTGSPFGNANANAKTVLFEEGARFVSVAGGNPFALAAPQSVVIFASGSYYEHKRTTAMSVSGRTYGNVVINSTNHHFYNVAFTQDWIIQNNLEVNEFNYTMNTVTPNPGNILVGGDIILHGNAQLFMNTAPLVLNGSIQNLQSDAENAITIRDLTVNNTRTVLGRNVNITGRLVLQQGIVESKANAMPVLKPGAVTESCSHDYTHLSYTNMGCDNAYVQGPLKKEGLLNSQFIFPVGAFNKVRPLILHNATGDFTVEFFLANPQDLSTTVGDGIHHISQMEYWRVDGGQASTELTFYDAYSGGVSDLDALLPAYYDGAVWLDIGKVNQAGTAGSNGSVTGGPILNSGYFTLAGSTAYPHNPLPHHPDIRINAYLYQEKILIDWNKLEKNHTYQLQKSMDGNKFTFVHHITAETFPQFIDYHPEKGVNYYRILSVDSLDKVRFSDVATINFSDFGEIIVYPNPASEKIFIKNLKSSSISKLDVVHINGSVVKQQVINNQELIWVDINNLPPGTYYIRANNGKSIPFIKSAK